MIADCVVERLAKERLAKERLAKERLAKDNSIFLELSQSELSMVNDLNRKAEAADKLNRA